MPIPIDTLAAWPGHWLTVTCACGRRAHLPVKLLARQHGEGASVAHLVTRLRCQDCGAKPIAAEMTDNPQRGESGYATGF